MAGNCFNCGKPGHRASECRGECSGCGNKHPGYKGEGCKKKQGAPGEHGGVAVPAGVAIASDEVQQMFAALAAFNKDTAAAINKTKSAQYYYNVLVTAAARARAIKLENNEKSKLWIDSGAGTTMLNDEHKNKFVDIHQSKGSVTVGNGATVEIKGVGTAKVKLKANEEPLALNNSVYVPGLAYNLISVGNLTDDGYDVIFEKYRRGVTILKSNGKEKEIVAKGVADGKLYRLEEANIGSHHDEEVLVTLVATTTEVTDEMMTIERGIIAAFGKELNTRTPTLNKDETRTREEEIASFIQLWHERMGHIDFGRVKQVLAKELREKGHEEMAREVMKSVIEFCDVCALGKSKRSPFTKDMKGRRSLEVNYRVHFDVCVVNETSLRGNTCYVAFIDDASNLGVTVPLKSKADVFREFIKYQTMMERQTDKHIKILRCDGAGEHTSGNFKEHADKLGMIFELTMRATSQQNGRAERRIQELNKMTRVAMAKYRTPTVYWDWGIEDAQDKLNAAPSKTVPGGISPYEYVFKRKPNFGEMRMTFCLAYMHLPAYWRDGQKHGARALPVMHLGWAKNKRGYRLFDPLTKTTYESRDVSFNEKQAHPGAYVWSSKEALARKGDTTNNGEEVKSVGESTNAHMYTFTTSRHDGPLDLEKVDSTTIEVDETQAAIDRGESIQDDAPHRSEVMTKEQENTSTVEALDPSRVHLSTGGGSDIANHQHLDQQTPPMDIPTEQCDESREDMHEVVELDQVTQPPSTVK
jgi:hypothetical protein